MNSVSRGLIGIGFLFIVLGLVWHFTQGKLPLGKLPGDIHYESQNSEFFFPVTTSILVSLVLSAVAYFFRR